MRYMGGKERIATKVVAAMQPDIAAAPCYVEPFVGGASVACRVQHEKKWLSDANEALVRMWAAACRGWAPPERMTREEYAALRAAQDPNDPMTAFAGFGCSFGGKWFGGYAASPTRNYCANARNSVAKKVRGLSGAVWRFGGYDAVPIPRRAVIYCDPPYANTTGYTAAGKFDSAAFWVWCRTQARRGRVVYVSEYTAPDFAECVAEFPTYSTLAAAAGEGAKVTEKLFKVHA